jgi:hypothetical protein
MWTQDGVITFEKHSVLRSHFYETFCDEFDMNELRQAIQETRRSPSSSAESSKFQHGVFRVAEILLLQPSRLSFLVLVSNNI